MATDLTPEQITQVKRLVGLALRYVGIRSRSREEMNIYLHRKAPDAGDAVFQAVFAKIDHFNILNDDRFAEEYTLAQLKRGKGSRWISLNLKQKGVDPATVKRILAGIDPDTMVAAAIAVIRKKRLTPEAAYRVLYARGFSGQIIRAVIDGYGENTVK